MEADEILTHAKNNIDLPQGWVVFPLLRNKVMTGLVGWASGIILGFGMFIFVCTVVIPFNYQRGVLPAVITTILLGVLLFIGLGSAWTFVSDIRRLREGEKHVIVITPEDFVKQEGERIVHVPLINIRYVTARGLPPPDRTADEVREASRVPGAGENTIGFLFGRGLVPSGMRQRRKRMRTPTSLAFMDTRDEKEVVVVNDGAFGDPFAIATVLKSYVASVQQLVG